ncbi:MAG: ABC transporter substrate-binding protein, partial [Abitibacteriaceae bacterium]|nr:ABC transporter substrate-binding protein [Abditibacteriaceae bacterium]
MKIPRRLVELINHRSLLVYSCVATAAALTGCGGQNSTNSASSDTSNTTTASTTASDSNATTNTAADKPSGKPFRVAYNQWIGLVGVFIAKDKGYFKDAGLDVDFKQFSGPADGVPPLIAGQLDAALTTADTPILLGKRAGDNSLSNVYITDTSNGADGIVAQKGIASIKDLKGKTVAATKGQVNEFLLLKGLQA